MKNSILAIGLVSAACFVQAQTLQEILKQAEVNHPMLKAKGFEVQASEAQLSLARSTAIPTLDAAYQLNYATYNNITGMAVAQGFVPISGPPSSSNEYGGVFGSAGGLLLNWEPFTFGQRNAKITSAKAYRDYKQADQALEIFHHLVRTANTYLDVLLAHEFTEVYSRNVERAENNLRIVSSLTRSGLRPGTDTALFKAELSRARIELLNYEQLEQTQAALLSELLGGSQLSYTTDSIFVSSLPIDPPDSASQSHPLLKLSMNRVTINQLERTSLRRTLYPRLSFWGTAYARGSGIRYDGFANSEDGLSFSRFNYGAGVVLSVPVLRFTTVRHEVNAAESLINAEEQRLSMVNLQLSKQNEVAALTLSNALRIAEETPAFFHASSFAYRTLLSRYNSGLVNYSDLIQAQYALVKSEADLKKAYVDSWKALLYKAAVTGDLSSFLNQLN
jgi:outer membrane protein